MIEEPVCKKCLHNPCICQITERTEEIWSVINDMRSEIDALRSKVENLEGINGITP